MTAAENEEYRRLESIHGSDFEMADGDPNIMGWEIKDVLGERLGEVEDILFNPSAMKVRYLVAKLDAAPVFQERKKVIIPIGLAELHESADLVFIPGIAITQLQAVPAYDPETFSPEIEETTLQIFRSDDDPSTGYDHDRLYQHRQYNMEQLYSKRKKLS